MTTFFFSIADSWTEYPSNLVARAAGLGVPALSVGSAPVVTGGTISASLPIAFDADIGSPVSATNSPTGWALTSNPGNCFAIDNSGQIYAISVDIPPQSYALIVQATNINGSGSATVTINVSTASTIYYVATTGNNTNNGLSPLTPFLTLAHAAGVAVTPGNAVLVLGGTYTIPTNLVIGGSGNSSNQIVWAPYQQATVTIACSNITSGGYIQLNGSYVTFMNFIVDGTGATSTSPCIANYQTTASRMIGNTIHDCQGSGIWCGGTSTNNAVSNNTIYNFCMNNLNHALGSAGGWGEGISFEGDTGTTNNGNVMYGNTVYQGWGEALGLYGAIESQVAYNTIFDCYDVMIYADCAENCSIYNNMVYSTGNTAYGYLGAGLPDGIRFAREIAGVPNSGNLVYNNIVVGTLAGISYYDYDSGGGMQNCKIMNNVCVNNTNPILIVADASHSGNIVEDNIFYGANPSGSATGFTFNFNCWFSSTRSGGFVGVNDITSSPSFVGSAGSFVSTDYQVTSGSPCKSAGTNLYSSGVTIDFGNNARPSSGNITIGAWQ